MSATDNGSIVSMVLVSAPGVVLAGTMERAEIRRGRVRDDRFMEISHSNVTSCYNCMTFYCGPPLSFTNDWVVSVNVGFNLHVNCVLYESKTTTCKNQQMIRIIIRHLFLTVISSLILFSIK